MNAAIYRHGNYSRQWRQTSPVSRQVRYIGELVARLSLGVARQREQRFAHVSSGTRGFHSSIVRFGAEGMLSNANQQSRMYHPSKVFHRHGNFLPRWEVKETCKVPRDSDVTVLWTRRYVTKRTRDARNCQLRSVFKSNLGILRARLTKGISHGPAEELNLNHLDFFWRATEISVLWRHFAVSLRHIAGTSAGIRIHQLGIRRPTLCLRPTLTAPSEILILNSNLSPSSSLWDL